MNHQNKVELIGFYGSDTVIACSAWTSTSRNLTEEKKARIPKLIDDLWSAGHETPFEKASVHFLPNTEIASHIHILKHRISSMNAESARYKELKEDKYYLPEDFKQVPISAKSLKFLHINNMTDGAVNNHPENWYDLLWIASEATNLLYHRCLVDAETVLGRKRAKESARFFKMYNSQIEGDLQFNMRSFANFLRLRRDGHAQREIHELADQMLTLVAKLPGNPFQHTLATWAKNGIIK